MRVKDFALFGGALWCAGLNSAVLGQEFVQPGRQGSGVDDYIYVNVYNRATLDDDGVLAYDIGLGNIRVNDRPFGYAYGSLQTTSMTAYADATNLAYGEVFAAVFAYVTVTEDAIFEVEWEFSGPNVDNVLSRGIRIFNFSQGGVSVFDSGSDVSGSASIELIAGMNYGITLSATVDELGKGFVNGVLVPTPGVAAVLGCGGVLAARRRR